MASTRKAGSFFLLQIAVGLFFLLMGLQGIINYDSYGSQATRFVNDVFGNNNNIINIIVSIGALISGVIILGGLFIPLKNSTLMIATLIVFIFWALKIAYFYFVNNLMEPNLITWLQNLSLQFVVLMSVWIINRKYS
ncbi:MAG: hypothetical protein KAH95_06940 [Spirochaetales bacterium]|nr:hypothetical protein [Spirochaetales bacterium]